MSMEKLRQSFTSANPPPRIIGTEMEYTVSGNLYSTWRARLEQTMKLSMTAGGYLANGALLYNDCGHLEYASAESLGPLDAAASDHAGKLVIGDLHDKVETDDLPPLRRSATIQVDDETGTYECATKGYHENYLTPEPRSELHAAIFKSVIGSHLATRAIWNGAGLFTDDGYLLSQKATGIGTGVVDGFGQRTTHGEKPIAGLLKSQDKSPPQWNILEVRHADPHMLPPATFLALATTSLTLRMIELGVIHKGNYKSFSFENPVRIVHDLDTISRKDHLFRLKNNESTSALSFQRRLAAKAIEMCNHFTLPPDEQLAAHEWKKLCDDLSVIDGSEQSLRPLIGRVEWASKLFFANRKHFERESQAIPYDMWWSAVGKNSLSRPLVDRSTYPLNLRINKRARHYTSHAPSTRALIRSKLIRADRIWHVSWGEAKTDDDGNEKISLLNPYETRV